MTEPESVIPKDKTEAVLSERPRRRVLTDQMVAKLKSRAEPYAYPDPQLGGHYVRIQPKGPPHRFYVIARDPCGKQRWHKLGSTSELNIDESRELSRTVLKRLKAGEVAKAPPPVRKDSVAEVIDTWLKRHVDHNGLRSGAEIKRTIRKHILPPWHDKAFVEIKRSDVAKLLDVVEDNSGSFMADAVLTTLKSLANWYARGRSDDDYVPPFRSIPKRVNRKRRKRQRKIDDNELRVIWAAAESAGVYGAFIRVLLLTAQRRQKVRDMRWRDISPDGLWTIATMEREKGNPGVLKLPPQALEIIHGLPRVLSNDFIFATGSRPPIGNFARAKAAFDKKLAQIRQDLSLPPMLPWVVHDLRRCSRSLMSRAGVLPHIAERVLGHSPRISAVEDVYDVHDYRDEMAEALQRLANLIERIVGWDSTLMTESIKNSGQKLF